MAYGGYGYGWGAPWGYGFGGWRGGAYGGYGGYSASPRGPPPTPAPRYSTEARRGPENHLRSSESGHVSQEESQSANYWEK